MRTVSSPAALAASVQGQAATSSAQPSPSPSSIAASLNSHDGSLSLSRLSSSEFADWIKVDFPQTDSTLYRMGNAQGPRLDHVRAGREIPHEGDRPQLPPRPETGGSLSATVDAVVPGKGVSTSTTPQGMRGKNVWSMHGEYDPRLNPVNDHGSHVQLEPTHMMRLESYQEALRWTQDRMMQNGGLMRDGVPVTSNPPGFQQIHRTSADPSASLNSLPGFADFK